MKQSLLKAFLPILTIFVAVTLFCLAAPAVLRRMDINQGLIITGNLLLFVVTAASFQLFRKGLYAQNTHGFLRNVYSAIMLKFFVLIFAAFIYIYLTGSSLSKGGILTMVVLYFVYMFSEVALLMNVSRQIRESKNA